MATASPPDQVVTLPLLLAKPHGTDGVTPADVTASVLIVDDNPAKRLSLKAVLSPLGYRIVEADSGIAALHRVMEEDFAVILLDVRMPGIDGFETAMLIRQRRQSEMTPIIFVTAHRQDEIDQTERYVQGAVDFMFAPVQPAELRAKVSCELSTRGCFGRSDAEEEGSPRAVSRSLG